MRMNAKELIAEARVTTPTLPPAASKLMTAMADRLDVQFVAVCESRNELKQLAAENAARGEIIERLIGQYSCAGLHAVEGSFHPGQSLLYDAMQVMKSNAGEAAVACLRAKAITDALENSSQYLDADCVMDRHDISYEDAELRVAGAMEMRDSLVVVANHLRSKSEVQS